MGMRCRRVATILVLALAILCPSIPRALSTYTVASTILVVNVDGSVDVIQTLRYFNPGENISLPLIGDPIYIEVTSSGVPQPIEIQDGELLIVEPLGDEISIRYVVTDLTNKTGDEWVLAFKVPWDVGVILPNEAMVLEVAPDDFDVGVVNDTVVLLFHQGEVRIKYILIHVYSGQETQGGATSPASSVQILGVVASLIPGLIVLTIVAFMTYLASKLLRRRRGVDIVKSSLDDRDEQIINLLKSHGELTAKEIMYKTGIPKTPLYRRLKKLVKLGLLERRVERGVIYYKIRRFS